MPTYAVHDGYIVTNVVVADSQTVAEEVTGFSAVETTGAPWTDWTLEVDGWRPPTPYASWQWDGSAWQPPTPMPIEGNWYWDEDTLSWVEATA